MNGKVSEGSGTPSEDQDPTGDTASGAGTADASPPGPDAGQANDSNPALRQLESILQNLATYAKPALRDIAVRAAEIAAKAGEAAGPAAQRAAGMAEDLGGRVAAKSREVASDLRAERAAESAGPDSPHQPPANPEHA